MKEKGSPFHHEQSALVFKREKKKELLTIAALISLYQHLLYH